MACDSCEPVYETVPTRRATHGGHAMRDRDRPRSTARQGRHGPSRRAAVRRWPHVTARITSARDCRPRGGPAAPPATARPGRSWDPAGRTQRRRSGAWQWHCHLPTARHAGRPDPRSPSHTATPALACPRVASRVPNAYSRNSDSPVAVHRWCLATLLTVFSPE